MKASKNLYVRLNRVIGSLVLVFILSNILLVEETKAQCPPGYNYLQSVPMTLGTCDYFVDICTKCSPFGAAHGYALIRNIKVQDPTCFNNLTFSEIIEEFNRQVLETYYYSYLFPDPIPPCKEGWYEITIETPMCWKISNINGNMVLEVCEDSPTCNVTYRICNDLENQEFKYEYINHTISSEPFYCNQEHFPNNNAVMDIFNQLDEQQSSDCYYISTRCYFNF